MELIPTNEMNVIKGVDADGMPRFRRLSAHDLMTLLDKEVSEEVLKGYFPGAGFFGPLVGRGEYVDMRAALEVLRETLELHAMLSDCDSLIELDHDCWDTPLLKDAFVAEERAALRLEKIHDAISDYSTMSIEEGSGYSDEFNGDECIPQCHILTAEIALPGIYGGGFRSGCQSIMPSGVRFA